jgi:lipopolysaccharide transport protein LptA
MVTDVQRNRQTALAVRGPRTLELDRTDAFRRARQHTLLVRTLRIALPIVTLLVFASYGLFVGRAYEIGVGDGKLTIGPVSLSSDSVTAENPHFEGFNKDGDKFVVKAKSAEHDLKRSGPIGLKLIEGTLFEPHNAVTMLNAPRGSFDTKTEVLELEERIEIKSNTGLRALLTRATVSIKDNRIVSGEPVSVEMPAGVVRGNELVMLPKARQAVFSNGVVARFERQAPAGGAGAASPADGLGTGDAPIDVTAATLTVDDVKRLAVFSGEARAVQGQANLTSSLLEVGYEGQPGAETAGATASASGRINRIIARRNVVITQEADRATCDTAEFDPVADTALLTGSVVVAQGANVLKGGRLFLDRKSATSQLTSPARGNEPKGRINAHLQPAPESKRATAPRRTTEQDGEPILAPRDPNAPIDIEADRLDVDDRAKSAVFRGNVFVRQGDYTMHTAELVARYTGDSGLAAGLQGQQASGRQAMQLETVRARNSVLMTSKDGQSAKGDWADFDVKANLVTLVGNVVLTQGGNTVTGPRAVMNLTTGEAQIVPDAVSATTGDAATGSAASGGGRPKLLLYPNQLKDKEKAKPKGSESGPKRDGKDTSDSLRRSAGAAATRTSGWSAETTPATPDDD